MTAPRNPSSGNALGYPIIEKLIDSEDFVKVNQSMSQGYDTLERMLKQKGGLKKQKSIRQALKAYDLSIDLLRFLLKTKYELAQKNQPAQGGKAKK